MTDLTKKNYNEMVTELRESGFECSAILLEDNIPHILKDQEIRKKWNELTSYGTWIKQDRLDELQEKAKKWDHLVRVKEVQDYLDERKKIGLKEEVVIFNMIAEWLHRTVTYESKFNQLVEGLEKLATEFKSRPKEYQELWRIGDQLQKLLDEVSTK